METHSYDVIVVGARVAGSTLALNLARGGRRVLLLDRTHLKGDTLSTHFVWPRGASYLKELGLLDKVLEFTPSGHRVRVAVEGIALEGELTSAALRERYAHAHGRPAGEVTTRYFSARRKYLDPLLLEAAVEAGVEFRGGVSVESLLESQGKVVGVRGTTKEGTPVEARAPLVVGADGRQSVVARLVGSPRKELRHACTFAAYTYVEGLKEEGVRIERRGRLGVGLVPTNDGAHMALLFGPKDWMAAFSGDRDGNFRRGFEFVNPDLGGAVGGGRRVEPFYVTNEQTAFIRQSSGPGWALVGDAACFKDQCTASGMTHAFRDAVLLSQCLETGGETALREYSERRFLDSWKYFEFVASQAEMNPPRPEELELYRALADTEEGGDLVAGVFADTVPPAALFSETSKRRLLRGRLGASADYRAYERSLYRAYDNPFDGRSSAPFFVRNCVDYATPVGSDLIRRVEPYFEWQQGRLKEAAWQYSRTLEAFPGPMSRMKDDGGRRVDGINFASQDYLALGGHPRLREAARGALEAFGPHSAGSPMVIGNTTVTEDLEDEIRELTGMEHVVLFSTGWQAGFGSLNGLVRPEDHIVMDRLSHACLQQGARAATRKLHRHPHLDAAAARALLGQIRAKDRRNGILVITEGIFSMDSDAPDLNALREACGEFGATLFVDVAHDLGALGPGGGGIIAAQGLRGKVDLVMGSFSKTFASNGGFLATGSAAVKEYVKMYSNTHMFSNALSPVQAAVAREAFRIVRSEEGEGLRQKLMANVLALREGLEERGVPCLGQPSAIVPVIIGQESVARRAHGLTQERQIAAMILEYPVVAVGASRYRLQVMASHTVDQCRQTAATLAEVLHRSRQVMEVSVEVAGTPAECAIMSV